MEGVLQELKLTCIQNGRDSFVKPENSEKLKGNF
jgi:hypothetical protein